MAFGCWCFINNHSCSSNSLIHNDCKGDTCYIQSESYTFTSWMISTLSVHTHTPSHISVYPPSWIDSAQTQRTAVCREIWNLTICFSPSLMQSEWMGHHKGDQPFSSHRTIWFSSFQSESIGLEMHQSWQIAVRSKDMWAQDAQICSDIYSSFRIKSFPNSFQNSREDKNNFLSPAPTPFLYWFRDRCPDRQNILKYEVVVQCTRWVSIAS